MTIGIAAYGPRAGLAVLRSLAAVETIGRGSIGGFVSLVVLTAAGEVKRAQTQVGGGGSLFPGGFDAIPAELATAQVAGLISSGPNRPEPLSQFTPALARVGLVTGHRMPNTVGASGRPINEDVLDRLRRGVTAEEAVEGILAANPLADAGVIALTAEGDLFAADTAQVARRGDSGRRIAGARADGAVVGVLHNSIYPFRPLAALAAEVALDVMQPDDTIEGWITFRAGAPLRPGAGNAVEITADGIVESIVVEDRRFLTGDWSVGLGYETPVLRAGSPVGLMLHEPYMVVRDGFVRSIDGAAERRSSLRAARPGPTRR